MIATTFPVTITTTEELRFAEQNKQVDTQREVELVSIEFDEADHIRAHGLGCKLGAATDEGTLVIFFRAPKELTV